MIRIFSVGPLIIVLLFSLHAFALEEDKSIHQDTRKGVSVAKTDKEVPDSQTKDLNGSLKTKEPKRGADHDHYGKLLIFRVLAGGGTRR